MIASERKDFVRELLARVGADLERMAEAAPEDWDGHELRVLVSDEVTDAADPRDHQWPPARRKEFQKQRARLRDQIRSR